MTDLKTIAYILSHYHSGIELEPVELEILCDWLDESQANEDFLTELSNNPCWLQDSPSKEIYHRIRSKLVSQFGQ